MAESVELGADLTDLPAHELVVEDDFVFASGDDRRQAYREHFEMLELPLDATFDEVHKSYLLLKETYSSETLATLVTPM